mmetsp:Transcript_147376/g.274655  ORF Transcript_147376/g.274655 Transcript_147376/m.274655 type:complete len:574 (-) Transcript_147376:80-1801(-)
MTESFLNFITRNGAEGYEKVWDMLQEAGMTREAASLELSALSCWGGQHPSRKGPQPPRGTAPPIKPLHWTDTPSGYDTEVSKVPKKLCRKHRKSVETMDIMGKGFSSGCVFVHVYDWGTSGLTTLLNSYAHQLGAFHSGVEIYGSEWCFGGTVDSTATGIIRIPPRSNTEHQYRTTIPMGVTKLTPSQVESTMEALKEKWLGHTYDMFTKNCNHFADALCCSLGCDHIPAWIFGALQVAPKQKILREWTEESNVSVPAERQPMHIIKRAAVLYGAVPMGVRPAISAALEAGLGDYGMAHLLSFKLSETQVTEVLEHLDACTGMGESYNLLSWKGNYFSDVFDGLLGCGSDPADTLSKILTQGPAPAWIFKALSCNKEKNLLRELTEESVASEHVAMPALYRESSEACCEIALQLADPVSRHVLAQCHLPGPRTPVKVNNKQDKHRSPLSVLDDNVQKGFSQASKMFDGGDCSYGVGKSVRDSVADDVYDPFLLEDVQHKHYHGPENSPEAWMSYKGMGGLTFWHHRDSGRPPWQEEADSFGHGEFAEHLRREANGELCLLRWEDDFDMEDVFG